MTKEEHIQYISNIRETLYSIENNSAKISGLKDYDWVAIRAAHRLLGEYLESFKPSIPSDVEEAAETFAESIWKEMRYELVYDNLTESFKAGAEWQAEKCDEETSKLLYAERQTAYINGWDDHKEQMLKDAVEGKIYGYDDGSYELVASWLDLPKGGIYKDGDKVRVIICKMED